jgi:hypothetical protein
MLRRYSVRLIGALGLSCRPTPLSDLSRAGQNILQHQFRTGNDRIKAQRRRAIQNENAGKSTNLTVILPLTTVWLQVRILQGWQERSEVRGSNVMEHVCLLISGRATVADSNTHSGVANSRYLQNALASRIWRGVLHSTSNKRGDATTTQMHFAREVATFRRLAL